MGRRGPAPKPTVLRVLEGNPSHRPLPKAEPKPRTGKPERPASLDPIAQRVWDAKLPELLRMGLMTVVDDGTLALYCQAMSEWEQADLAIQEHGLTIVAPTGALFARPEVRIRDTAAKRAKALAAEFGFSPASRTRINTDRAQDESQGDGILS